MINNQREYRKAKLRRQLAAAKQQTEGTERARKQKRRQFSIEDQYEEIRQMGTKVHGLI